ncbi:hypothetical protein LRS73_31890 [Methylobacterium currus]|uniref:hypothetical protein n=1 Tax=Methylobacterium currus TaxID=2051553 RepID=UPI001E363CED|nr:hypothetical protein [Methylobacterium currus]UHC19459.1 hypothetical protein LRS73_31890 [Methylobacterium currus]
MMSDLVITHGAGVNSSEVLASGVVRLEYPRAFTFSHSGKTVIINALVEQPPRAPNGNYFLPLPAGALLPGADASHQLGEATVYVQMTALARPQGYIGPDAFLFSYEVTRPLPAPLAKAA